MKHLSIYTLFFTVCLSHQSFAAEKVSPLSSRCELSPEIEERMLSEPLERFDADPQMGWRLLAQKGCQIEAAQLLEKYRAKNGDSYRTAFHEAQIRLAVGDAANARPLLFLSLRSDISGGSPFKWNEFVLGYLAFIDRDKDALSFYISKLEQHSTDFRNQSNEKVLIKLFENFEKPYSEIFSR